MQVNASKTPENGSIQRRPYPMVIYTQPSLARPYRGTSLVRNCASLGPYSRTMPRALRWSLRGGHIPATTHRIVQCTEAAPPRCGGSTGLGYQPNVAMWIGQTGGKSERERERKRERRERERGERDTTGHEPLDLAHARQSRRDSPEPPIPHQAMVRGNFARVNPFPVLRQQLGIR